MKLPQNQKVHLTYCLNVHAGETWAENFEAIKSMALAVRDRAAPRKTFGLGLRLSRQSAYTLAQTETLKKFKDFLKEHDLYVFTINGFPYGDFHRTPVKENVYQPDWRTTERRDYTILLAEILAGLLPDGVSGSISTVPGSYKKWITCEEDKTAMIYNLADCAAHLDNISRRSGKYIHIGLEPEPDCFIETAHEAARFIAGDLRARGKQRLAQMKGCSEHEAEQMIARHIGVCFDTCHFAVQFENLRDNLEMFKKHNVLISKIQISSALKTVLTEEKAGRLGEFDDSTYLHQVRTRSAHGRITPFTDLSHALANGTRQQHAGEEWRIHCHVPLYFSNNGGIESTSDDLTPGFFRAAIASGAEHFEIETYTFNVLPETMRNKGIVDSIAAEYEWVLNKLHAA